MQLKILHNKARIEIFLRTDPFLHIYSIGDLDEFFWNHTVWYAAEEAGKITALLLLFTGLSTPTLLALSGDITPLKALLGSTIHLMPAKFYTHLSPGAEEVLDSRGVLLSHGKHNKMGLLCQEKLPSTSSSKITKLDTTDLELVLDLYKVAYPGNWFEARMLETGKYMGLWDKDKLVAIAGVHVFSPVYKVAALGNITTHPDYRNRGLGTELTAALCRDLLNDVNIIGLNVGSENGAAISAYRKLGFEITHTYCEYTFDSLLPKT